MMMMIFVNMFARSFIVISFNRNLHQSINWHRSKNQGLGKLQSTLIILITEAHLKFNTKSVNREAKQYESIGETRFWQEERSAFLPKEENERER
ncbi:hypothetical protein [Paenibacillus guangzhouensis]|uniref:hypothetical protein n=1 Tax=Paenibacillus guangzhouensis TaxID=1473112 RepID=UPI00187B9DE7|nr:hypothetical protein [Paenibacillus guangzhouensis]